MEADFEEVTVEVEVVADVAAAVVVVGLDSLAVVQPEMLVGADQVAIDFEAAARVVEALVVVAAVKKVVTDSVVRLEEGEEVDLQALVLAVVGKLEILEAVVVG
jgi:hypothetical protein